MKTLFIMMLAAGFALPAVAQRHYDDRSDNAYNNRHDERSDRYDGRDAGRRMEAIDRHFSDRINEVRHQPFMRAREKRRRIHQLENERRRALDECRVSYDRNGRGYAGRDRHWNDR